MFCIGIRQPGTWTIERCPVTQRRNFPTEVCRYSKNERKWQESRPRTADGDPRRRPGLPSACGRDVSVAAPPETETVSYKR